MLGYAAGRPSFGKLLQRRRCVLALLALLAGTRHRPRGGGEHEVADGRTQLATAWRCGHCLTRVATARHASLAAQGRPYTRDPLIRKYRLPIAFLDPRSGLRVKGCTKYDADPDLLVEPQVLANTVSGIIGPSASRRRRYSFAYTRISPNRHGSRKILMTRSLSMRWPSLTNMPPWRHT